MISFILISFDPDWITPQDCYTPKRVATRADKLP